MTNKTHVFTKSFWTKSRIVWATLVGFCASVPIVFGTIMTVTKWADANIVSPYVVCKIDSVCDAREKPLKEDIRMIAGDMRFIRECMEQTTPRDVQDKINTHIRRDSIMDSKYSRYSKFH